MSDRFRILFDHFRILFDHFHVLLDRILSDHILSDHILFGRSIGVLSDHILFGRSIGVLFGRNLFRMVILCSLQFSGLPPPRATPGLSLKNVSRPSALRSKMD